LARRVLVALREEARSLQTVVAAKAELEKKVEELEWRLTAELRAKKKLEKENKKSKERIDQVESQLEELRVGEKKRKLAESNEGERLALKQRLNSEEIENIREKLQSEKATTAALQKDAAEMKEIMAAMERKNAELMKENQRLAAVAAKKGNEPVVVAAAVASPAKDSSLAQSDSSATVLRHRLNKTNSAEFIVESPKQVWEEEKLRLVAENTELRNRIAQMERQNVISPQSNKIDSRRRATTAVPPLIRATSFKGAPLPHPEEVSEEEESESETERIELEAEAEEEDVEAEEREGEDAREKETEKEIVVDIQARQSPEAAKPRRPRLRTTKIKGEGWRDEEDEEEKEAREERRRERMKKKQEGEEFERLEELKRHVREEEEMARTVASDNASIMALIPGPDGPVAKHLIDLLLGLDHGFVSGVPLPAFAIFCFLGNS